MGHKDPSGGGRGGQGCVRKEALMDGWQGKGWMQRWS